MDLPPSQCTLYILYMTAHPPPSMYVQLNYITDSPESQNICYREFWGNVIKLLIRNIVGEYLHFLPVYNVHKEIYISLQINEKYSNKLKDKI